MVKARNMTWSGGAPRAAAVLLVSLLAALVVGWAGAAPALAERTVSIQPGTTEVGLDQTFTLAVSVDDASRLAGVQVEIAYDGALLEFVPPERAGALLAGQGWVIQSNHISPGVLRVVAYSPLLVELGGGSGSLFLLDFHTLAVGTSSVLFQQTILSDGTGTAIPSVGAGGSVTIGEVNRAPVLDPIGDQSVAEGELLSFPVSATDPDGDPLIYSASGLPAGASFDAASRTFTWTPGYGQAGSYPGVQFEVSDGVLTDVEAITITVTEVNRAPVLDPIGDQSVAEGELLSFPVSATDPDGDPLTYSASGLPAGASFDAASRTFTWTPGYEQAGSYPGVHFEVSDGVLTDVEEITITVTEVAITDYLVGDVEPPLTDLNGDGDTWDAGEFGDDDLLWDDVAGVLHVWSVPVAQPPTASDLFDAADAYPRDTEVARGGDGILTWGDIITTCDRYANPLLPRPRRAARAVATAERTRVEQPAVAPLLLLSSASAAPGTTARIPVSLELDVLSADRFGFSVGLAAGADASATATIVGFEKAPSLPEPVLAVGAGGDQMTVAWLVPMAAASDTVFLGTVLVDVPADALATDTWTLYVIAAGISLGDDETDPRAQWGPDAVLSVAVPEVHDVAITDMRAAPRARRLDGSVRVTVQVLNRAAHVETANLILRRGDTDEGQQTITLLPGRSTRVTWRCLITAADAPSVTFTVEALLPDDATPEDNFANVTVLVKPGT